MKSIFPLAILFICTGCTPTASPQPIEIDALLAVPATYQDQVVQIRGAVVARFEAIYICPGLEQIDSGRSKECLWLKPGLVGEGLGPDELGQYHKKWVVLVGKFDKKFTGHMDAYGGSIVPIAVQIIGSHGKGDIPPPPPEPSANNSFKPNLLRSTKHMAG